MSQQMGRQAGMAEMLRLDGGSRWLATDTSLTVGQMPCSMALALRIQDREFGQFEDGDALGQAALSALRVSGLYPLCGGHPFAP